ncbi:MAG TPA: type I restriction enzyme endonuclease domain-containing protein, partial [Methylomicrobium sp.]|nr:type I restriction enzyme endonuclease domain-containing protein [Methylomicrobium sp.]
MIRFPGKGGLQKVEIHPCPTYRSTGQDSCRRPDRVIVAEQLVNVIKRYQNRSIETVQVMEELIQMAKK